MSSFTQEAGRPRLSDTLSQRLTHTSVGTTKTGSKYRWAHAVPWSIAQNWDIQPKPVQDSVRTPQRSGGIDQYSVLRPLCERLSATSELPGASVLPTWASVATGQAADVEIL